MIPPTTSRSNSRRKPLGTRRRLVVRATCATLVLTGLSASGANAAIPGSLETPSRLSPRACPGRFRRGSVAHAASRDRANHRPGPRWCATRTSEIGAAEPQGPRLLARARRSQTGSGSVLAGHPEGPPGVHRRARRRHRRAAQEPLRLHRHGRHGASSTSRSRTSAAHGRTTARASSTTTSGRRSGYRGTTRSRRTPEPACSSAPDPGPSATACATTASTASVLQAGRRHATSCCEHNEIAGQQHRRLGVDPAGLRLHRWRQVLGHHGAIVTDNWVHHNHGPGLWADTNNVGFLFQGNYISDNDAGASCTRSATTR